MKFPSWSAGLVGALLFPVASAIDLLEATSLVPCSDDGIIDVDYFKVVFTPGNSSAQLAFDGQIDYLAKFKIEVELLVYGYSALTKELDPCNFPNNGLGMCPPTEKQLTVPSTHISVDKSLLSNVPRKW